MKLTATQQDGWPTINSNRKPANDLRRNWTFKFSSRLVIGSGPAQTVMESRPYWHLLPSAGNSCLSIQLLVPYITHSYHFLFANSQFLGAYFKVLNHAKGNIVSPSPLPTYWQITERCPYNDRKGVAVCWHHFYSTKTGNIKTSISKNFGWEIRQHGLEILEHDNFSCGSEY